MELVAIVMLLAVIEYVALGMRVGRARGQYGVEAPATTGHPMFERHFRIHQNTLEQMAVFLPSLWVFALYVSAPLAALLGLLFVVARFVYARGYLADPNKREIGMILTVVATLVLLVGGLVGAVVHLLK
jgi:glutathione S-transferase